MSARPKSHRGTRLGIVGAGVIGVLVAARTAAFYLDVDRVAFALSLLIAAGLAFGIVELLGRVARVERIEGELARLPSPATIEAIDATSAPLRTVLRARLSGVRATIPSAGFASYLVGLLVMVGLLGTFLGLVDALRGAREALGASGDIDALRDALATPMLGLSRAFGTSAAGLCASAMLGLASVLARRDEAALATAVHGYADDALGPLTIAERQIAVLEALVRQNAESAAAAARASAAIEKTAAALRTDVSSGVADVARAIEQALTPALDRAVARASDVTRERLDDWTRIVEREAETRRARDAALADAWSEVAGQSADRVAREGARVLGELQGALSESLTSLDARLGASIDALAKQLGARTQKTSDDLEARLAATTTTVGAMIEALAGELETTRARLDRTLEATGAALEAQAERSLARERAREETIDARMSALASAEAHALTRLERHVEAVDAALATHLERMSAMQRDAAREAADRAVALDVVLRDHAAALTETTGAMLAEAARRAETASAAAERVVSATRDEIALREASERAQAARAEAVLAGLAQTADQVSARTADVLTAHAERQGELETRWIAAREAAERAQTARTEAVLSGLAQAAEQVSTRAGDVLTAHAERQGELETRWIAAHEAAERAQAERTEAVLSGLAQAAEQVSTRAGRVLDDQAERQSAIEARWLAAQETSAARLVALLEQHAEGLAQGLAATRSLVEDTAGLLRASGVEMGAVAEVFTGAVDRYREASAACLGALAGLDGAVDQAGKKAAIELLTDYLDQTREVFEHSLEVQRELFAELRALRGRGQGAAETTRVRA
ncbi:hypothetical protein [Sandaracinus amylolyticus]|uniref:hypothetical protein n=1 Tax=Sandaracinus amylolyticus TaxID=927083 RepID=UPI001F2C8738|nr:hypothetical protein [Sandaracinus amylolyticus]UJR83230.1 Hypothetical protein I5071_52970 [Sandaracinus amylolyticus]